MRRRRRRRENNRIEEEEGNNRIVVRFQVASEVFLFPKLFVAARTFVGFLPSMNALVSD